MGKAIIEFNLTTLQPYTYPKIYIFDSDLVWRMQLMIINRVVCLLIEFVIPNLSLIYFCVPEIFKTNV